MYFPSPSSLPLPLIQDWYFRTPLGMSRMKLDKDQDDKGAKLAKDKKQQK